MYFNNQEIKYIESVVKISINYCYRTTKITWCKQKQYPLEKWQNIDSISKGIKMA